METGQIERSIVALLDINCNSLQVQNFARSSIEYGEFGIDSASNPKDISIPVIIMADLEQMRVLDPRAADTAVGEDDSDDSEGLTSDPLVVPPISLNEVNLHLIATPPLT